MWNSTVKQFGGKVWCNRRTAWWNSGTVEQCYTVWWNSVEQYGEKMWNSTVKQWNSMVEQWNSGTVWWNSGTVGWNSVEQCNGTEKQCGGTVQNSMMEQ